MMNINIRKETSGWSIISDGEKVSKCIFDFAVTLQLGDNLDFCTFVRIENDFIVVSDKVENIVEIENVESMGYSTIVLKKELVDGYVSENGKLELKFSSNITLIVQSHESYEAWNIVTADGARLVCMPSGTVAYWEANSENT